jgi:hypothetical protein
VDAIKLAVACGSANCRAAAPGQISPELVRQALDSVQVAPLAPGAA